MSLETKQIEMRQEFADAIGEQFRAALTELRPTPADKPMAIEEDTKPEQAKMEQSAASLVSRADRAFGLGIPWGSVALGLIPGVVIGEVIDGMVAPKDAEGKVRFQNLFLKGVAAYGATRVLPGLVGGRASQFFAAALALQIIGDLLPVEDWVRRVVNALKGIGSANTGVASDAEAYLRLQRAKADMGQPNPPVTPGHDRLAGTF